MRTRLALAAPLLLVAVSACSGSGDTKEQTLEPTATPTATASAPAPGVTATAPTGGTKPTAQATAQTSTQAPVPGSSPAAVRPLSTQAPGKAAVSKATAAGKYTYTSSGTVSFGGAPQSAKGTQTLTISAIKNGIQHSTLTSDENGTTEQDIVVKDTGSYGASLKLDYGNGTIVREFRPDPAVLLMPDPAVVGKAWTWKATSVDGKTKATATNKLLRKESLTIGGTKVDAVVLSTHLVISDPEFQYEADVTLWWAPAYRLPVKQRTVGSGTFGAFPFSTDVTATMTSVKPS